MSEQWWGWILSFVGAGVFLLAGRKIWWCWYVGLALQGLWAAYALVTHQYGFLVGCVFYSAVYAKNAYDWTREHRHQYDLNYYYTDPRIGPRTGAQIIKNPPAEDSRPPDALLDYGIIHVPEGEDPKEYRRLWEKANPHYTKRLKEKRSGRTDRSAGTDAGRDSNYDGIHQEPGTEPGN